MKKIFLALLIASSLFAEVDINQRDKQYHITATALISTVTAGYFKNKGYSKTEAFFYGLAAGMLAGLAKEAYDEYKYGGYNNADMYADLIGSTAGSAISCQFSWEF